MSTLTFGFIGLGLIGGSIARAIRQNLPQSQIIAYDINADTLREASQCGVANTVTTKIDASFSTCDYLFLCAPVQKNDENLSAVKEILSPKTLLTDVGSVKSEIHKEIKKAGLEGQFIGGHPMAGSDRVGFINSKAVLLENAYYILTPTASVPENKVTDYKNLVQQLGAIPLILDPAQHDYVTAAVSHLPHIIAASLVNLVRDKDSADGLMKMIAAGGFKDITRIASSSAAVWQQICLTNTENISTLLSSYIASLQGIQQELNAKRGDDLYELFDSARIYRDSFINTASGPLKSSYAITIDIADEPGEIAAVATILALKNISIKNIGIVHNREYEGGVLRIEFYQEEAIENPRRFFVKRATVYTTRTRNPTSVSFAAPFSPHRHIRTVRTHHHRYPAPHRQNTHSVPE